MNRMPIFSCSTWELSSCSARMHSHTHKSWDGHTLFRTFQFGPGQWEGSAIPIADQLHQRQHAEKISKKRILPAWSCCYIFMPPKHVISSSCIKKTIYVFFSGEYRMVLMPVSLNPNYCKTNVQLFRGKLPALSRENTHHSHFTGNG